MKKTHFLAKKNLEREREMDGEKEEENERINLCFLTVGDARSIAAVGLINGSRRRSDFDLKLNLVKLLKSTVTYPVIFIYGDSILNSNNI